MSDPGQRLEDQRLRALLQTGLVASSAMPELENICRRAKDHFRVTIALVSLITKDTLVVRAKAGTDWEEVPRTGQFCDYTIRSDEPLVVSDAAQDPRFVANPVVTGDPHIRFYAGAPLIYQRDIRLGALALLDPQPREFSLGDRAELEAMADEAVSVIIRQELDRTSRRAGL